MLKTSILKIKDIVIEEKLYPRIKPIEHTIQKYAKEMKKGDKFPAIYIGKFKGKLYLLDGRHRLEAYKVHGEKYVTCEIKENFPTFNDMFLAAFRANQKHGHQLSERDIRKVAMRLSEMKYDIGDIVKLTGISLKKATKQISGKVRHVLVKKKIAEGKVSPTLSEKSKTIESISIMAVEDEQEANLKEMYAYVSTEKFKVEFKVIETLIRKIKKMLHKRYPKL